MTPPQLFKPEMFATVASAVATAHQAQAIFEKWYRTAMESLEDARVERTKRFNADPNEEFSCGKCGKEVWGRYLFCSNGCSNEFEDDGA